MLMMSSALGAFVAVDHARHVGVRAVHLLLDVHVGDGEAGAEGEVARAPPCCRCRASWRSRERPGQRRERRGPRRRARQQTPWGRADGSPAWGRHLVWGTWGFRGPQGGAGWRWRASRPDSVHDASAALLRSTRVRSARFPGCRTGAAVPLRGRAAGRPDRAGGGGAGRVGGPRRQPRGSPHAGPDRGADPRRRQRLRSDRRPQLVARLGGPKRLGAGCPDRKRGAGDLRSFGAERHARAVAGCCDSGDYAGRVVPASTRRDVHRKGACRADPALRPQHGPDGGRAPGPLGRRPSGRLPVVLSRDTRRRRSPWPRFMSRVFTDIRGRSTTSDVLWASSLSVASLTAYARVKAGMHYPSDVLVGAAVGTAIGLAVPWLHRGMAAHGRGRVRWSSGVVVRIPR